MNEAVTDQPNGPSFFNPAAQGFARIACVAPLVALGDVATNVQRHIQHIAALQPQAPDVIVFPELSLTGYSLDDLLMQDALLCAARDGVDAVVAASEGLDQLIIAGAPIAAFDAVFNCAVLIHDGALIGMVPKTHLPNYREYYERRHFAPADRRRSDAIGWNGKTVPFAPMPIIVSRARPELTLSVELCEDMWAPIPPSTYAALAGARVIVNLSASNVTIGKSRERARLCLAHSQRAACAYAYATSGPGESTNDLAWDGQLGVFELGEERARSQRYQWKGAVLVQDVDLRAIEAERRRLPTFHDDAALAACGPVIEVLLEGQGQKSLIRNVERFPFIRTASAHLDEECAEAYAIQVEGLGQRLRASGISKAVIGVSGGLDSCHALLVVVDTFRKLDRPLSDIHAFSLTGFASTDASAERARVLCDGLGVTHATVDLRPLCQAMLKAIGHPAADGEKVYDITFENVQAGMRTDFLFRRANQIGALVVGTGDLSEAALGWSTYGVGDHMSHYGVNAGVPKTLIQQLIAWNARSGMQDARTAAALEAILAAEITPELIPIEDGEPAQSTQASIGPYALHDFFLHYAARWGFAPSRIAYLALEAWVDAGKGDWPPHLERADRRAYSADDVFHWLGVFVKRFYQTSQFKRSATPNAPKVTSGGALSPRGDWRAPSDMSARLWLDDLEAAKTWYQLSLTKDWEA
jgi:NAD+ synthase (glutamine-hydrolysing)